jgi:hypothetical protein
MQGAPENPGPYVVALHARAVGRHAEDCAHGQSQRPADFVHEYEESIARLLLNGARMKRKPPAKPTRVAAAAADRLGAERAGNAHRITTHVTRVRRASHR